MNEETISEGAIVFNFPNFYISRLFYNKHQYSSLKWQLTKLTESNFGLKIKAHKKLFSDIGYRKIHVNLGNAHTDQS